MRFTNGPARILVLFLAAMDIQGQAIGGYRLSSKVVQLFVLLLTLMFSVQVLAGMNQWTRTGIQIAPFARVVVDPRNDAVLYVETTNGVYKSPDRGDTWNKKSTGLPQGVVSQLVVSPHDSSILFVLVATASNGPYNYYRSSDGGESWVATDLAVLFTGNAGMPVVPDPSNASNYYAYCLGRINTFSLCKSINGGLNWTQLTIPGIGSSLVIDASNPQLMLMIRGQAVSKSVDGGATWASPGTSGLPGSAISLLLATAYGFFAAIPTFGVYRSFDGIAWVPANGGIETKTVVELVTGPAGLYAVVQEHDLYLSTNLGSNWTKLGPVPNTASHLTVSNQNSQRLFLGDSAAGYQSSANDGSSWTNVTSNSFLPQNAVGNVLLSADGNTIFAGNRTASYYTTNASGWRSSDAGLSWSSSRYVYSINPDQLHVYGTGNSASSCFARSSDLGLTWLVGTSQPCPIVQNPLTIIFDAVSAQQTETIFLLINQCNAFSFARCNASVAESTDGGTTWNDKSTGIPYWAGNVLKLDPRNADILYLGTVDGVSKTMNGGGLWVSSNVGLPTNTNRFDSSVVKGVISLAISPHDSNVLYAGYSCDSSACYGVYKSITGGLSWSPVNNGLPTGFAVSSIVVDLVSPETVYLGTSGGGVFRTTDGGANWVPFNTGLDDLMVNSVAVDRSGTKLYAGTNSGVFSLTASGSTIPGGVMTVFGTRGTVTPTTPMYGSFALANTTVMYVAVRGPSLQTLGYTHNPLDWPNLRVYDASGHDLLNVNGGVVAFGCPSTGTSSSVTVSDYYASLGGRLDVRDTCLSGTFAAGVYTFTINPNTSSSSGEMLFEVRVNPETVNATATSTASAPALSSTIPGGVMTVFGTRGTVTPTTPMYGSFVLVNPSVIYIAVLGPTLGILGYTNNPLNLPNLRVYDASGNDLLRNASGGVTVSGCPSSATVANYYANVRGGRLDVNDTCLSGTFAAGVYTFTINPNTSSSSGEMLFEVTVNP